MLKYFLTVLDFKSSRLDTIKMQVESARLKRQSQNAPAKDSPREPTTASSTSKNLKAVSNAHKKPHAAASSSGHTSSSDKTRPKSAALPVKVNSFAKNQDLTKRNGNTVASDANAGAGLSLSKKLKIPNVEERLVSVILDEIVDHGQNIKFSDIGEFLV